MSGSLITATPTGSGLPCSGAVATSGEADKDPQFIEGTSPLVETAVDFESGQAEQTVTVPHSYSFDVDGDDAVDLKDVVVVKINRLPPPPPARGTEGPPEMRGPTTPITPPTTPPKPPVIQEPELEGNPPVVTGGGTSPKLHTGIKAKCPKTGKPCTVTGVVEAELPAPRPARKAGASRSAKIRRVVLGKVSFVLAAGASRTVVITLSKAGVALLRSNAGVRAKIAVTVTEPGATKASRTRTTRLRLPAPRRRG